MDAQDARQPSPPAALGPAAALRVIRAALADPGLTAAEKAVVAAIVAQADAATACAWASYRQLAADYGLSPKTIRAAIAKSTGRYLEPAGHGRHGAARHRILAPPSASPTEAPDPASASPTEAPAPPSASPTEARDADSASPTEAPAEAPGPPALPFGHSSASHRGTILTPYSKRKDPPTPRRRGAARAGPPAARDGEPATGNGGTGNREPGTTEPGTRNDGTGNPEPGTRNPEPETASPPPASPEADRLDGLAAAWREAWETALPWLWGRRARREIRHGAGELLDGVTAADLRAARAFGEARRLSWGFGTLRLFLETRRARAIAARPEAAPPPAPADPADPADKARRGRAAAALAAFRRLPAEDRETWIRLAAARPFANRRPDVLEAAAAALAAAAEAADIPEPAPC